MSKHQFETVYLTAAWGRSGAGLRAPGQESGPLLLLDHHDDLRTSLQAREDCAGTEIVLVKPGQQFRQVDKRTFEINPSEQADYRTLLQTLKDQHTLPNTFVHRWTTPAEGRLDAALPTELQLGFYPLVRLSKALQEQKVAAKVRLLYLQEAANPGIIRPAQAAVEAFAKSLALENEKLRWKTVELASTVAPTAAEMAERVLQELAAWSDAETAVRLVDGERFTRQLQEIATDHAVPSPLKKQGVYLITGGMGGLGLAFAKDLATRYQAKLILSGRSPLDESKSAALKALERLGSEVLYVQADVSKKDDSELLVSKAKAQFGQVHGVLHCAGAIRDAFLMRKAEADLEEVLAPKLFGTVYIDEAICQEPLDFFVLFSSIASVTGNVGQCDYAYANSFLDHYAAWRSQQGRPGRTVAINWPLWQEGGIQLGAAEQAMLSERTGLEALPTAVGLKAWERALGFSVPQCIVCYGNRDTITERYLQKHTGALQAERPAADSPSVDPDWLRERTVQFLKGVFEAILDLPAARIDGDTSFEEYGIDSVRIQQFNGQIERTLGALPKTLLFEYQTLNELVDYLLAHQHDALVAGLGLQQATPVEEPPVQVTPVTQSSDDPAWLESPDEGEWPQLVSLRDKQQGQHCAAADEEIAIIGLSGRYPKARNIAEFWENLRQAVDCISEVPTERWDIEKYYDPAPERAREGKMYAKWGGFLEDADKFDPLFFSISPKEAEEMDPQERIFLETAWAVLEDAGYTRKQLQQLVNKEATAGVGVFVGVTTNTYPLLGPEEWAKGNMVLPNSFAWSMANRVSYVFNFHGPSVPVDTACSSSLTAIHLACASLKKGECSTAIVGGVNLYLHPSKYISLCEKRMLSAEGRCHSFGAGGDGFVPGEGVGAVLLKPLRQAEADGDHIYAVIKASAINHGGHTTGYTVPNPNAQASLIVEALANANLDARTISYIEAHGTGTSLGDPIEVAGLTNAFRKHTNDTQFCALGSAKSNIGHLEASAGIAGLTKIILQMQHKHLVPSLHAETLNPNIDFAPTPFFVQREYQEWKNPVLVIDGVERTLPLRAGISSFGAGGANAHIILEAYDHAVSAARPPVRLTSREPHLFVLSARDAERLKAYAAELLPAIERTVKSESEAPLLRDISFTLLMGREEMEERLAIVAASKQELMELLAAYVQGKPSEHLFTGNTRANKAQLDLLFQGGEGEKLVQELLRERKLDKLAQLFALGASIQWQSLFPAPAPKRVSLPTYPFARDRYWITQDSNAAAPTGSVVSGSPKLHPTLDANESTLMEQRFRKLFHKGDFYVRDHVIAEMTIVPAAAYLEMAVAAGNLSLGGGKVQKLRQVIWAKPIVLKDQAEPAFISIYPGADAVEFEVSSLSADGQPVLHAKGYLDATDAPPARPEAITLAAILRRCPVVKSREQLYGEFQGVGYEYGPGLRSIRELCHSQTEALAHLELPADLEGEFSQYVMHPALVDGAFQALASLMQKEVAAGTAYLPFALGELELIRPLTSACHVYIQALGNEPGSDLRRFDIQLADAAGQVLLHIRDFTMKAFHTHTAVAEPALTTAVKAYFRPEWQQQALSASGTPDIKESVLLFDRDELLRKALQRRLEGLPAAIVLVKPGQLFRQLEDNVFELRPGVSEDYQQLLGALHTQNLLPGHIVHNWSREPFSAEPAALQSQLQMGVYSLFALSQALLQLRLTRPVRTLYLYGSSDGQAQPQYAGLAGFARTLRLENPLLLCQTIEWQGAVGATALAETILSELSAPDSGECSIRYAKGLRYVKHFTACGEAGAGTLPLKHRGVYLVTGGAGGLGLLFAEYLARKVKARLVLSGRSAQNAAIEAQLARLQALGAEAVYIQADVAKREDTLRLVAQIKQRFAAIDGIIHSAGVLRDGFVLRKTAQELDEVFAAKVFGTVHLDEATQDEPLDFFVLFSSLAGVLGNVGQSDYAYANSFMDHYAERRAGIRTGRSLSLNWPLWAEGGMQMDRTKREALQQELGLIPLRTETGIAAFEAGLRAAFAQWIVVEGQEEAVHRLFASEAQPAAAVPAPQQPPKLEASGLDPAGLRDKTEALLKGLLSQEIKLPVHKIDAQQALDKYGIDSLMVVELTRQLEKRFGPLSKTLLFEYKTVADLAGYLLAHHMAKLEAILGVATAASRGSLPTTVASQPTAARSGDRPDVADLREKTETFLKGLLSREIKLPVHKIDAQQALDQYGIDSLMVVELTRQLEKQFGRLSKTLLFEYKTISDLAGYLMEHYQAKLLELLGAAATPGKERPVRQQAQPDTLPLPPAPAPALAQPRRQRFLSQAGLPGAQPANPSETRQEQVDIAVIGVAGRYPMARDLDQFWARLKQGQDCISEIPADRWDYARIFDPAKGQKGKCYSKWGGFIDDVDKFDPLFFGILPREAEVMDPQERLFLETVYHTLEDAGYSKQRLGHAQVGVFVGVMYGHYQMLGAEESLLGNAMALSSSFASVANRVSYYFNFQGPSIALDTMCSSSLTAFHLACESIRRGESELAVAGGVNVSIHPHKYLFLSQGKFLATDGRCRAFGDGGDGYVPSEGVGAVLLKPLKKAVADGDRIYAVVKGTSVNHGGKTNGYSVPDPNAQASMIAETLKRAAVNPRAVSYVEAHGTGTALGDPIEITGLIKAFGATSSAKQFCAIGSVKSNIGHCEAAAGIAGITKVLLQLKHKQLAPSIHTERLNANINFSDTPFTVQCNLAPWKQPVIAENGVAVTYPRIASISSFGAGGSNAYAILQEYLPPVNTAQPVPDEPQLIVLSARNAAQLQASAKRLVEFLDQPVNDAPQGLPAFDDASVLEKARADVLGMLAGVLQTDRRNLASTDDMSEYGMDALALTEWAGRLNQTFGTALTTAQVAGYPSVEALLSELHQTSGSILARHYQAAPPEPAGRPAEARPCLADVAYTLQVGREPMDERLALVATSVDELVGKLRLYLAGQADAAGIYCANIKAQALRNELLVEGEEGQAFLANLIEHRKLDKLAHLWTSGVEIDWKRLSRTTAPAILSLPVYPFARDRYWLPGRPADALNESRPLPGAVTKLHPLIHRNTSTLREPRFTTVLSGADLMGYRLFGRHLLSAGTLLEMVRAAGTLAEESAVQRLQGFVLPEPVVISEAQELLIHLQPDQEGASCQVSSVGEHGHRTVLAQAQVAFAADATGAANALDLGATRTRCTHVLGAGECYRNLQAEGFDLGPELQTVERLYMGEAEALVQLTLPKRLQAEAGSFGMHPALLDGALHAAALWLERMHGARSTPHLLTAVASVECSGVVTAPGYAYVRLAEGQPSDGILAVDIHLLDEAGRQVAQLKQVQLAPVREGAGAAPGASRQTLLVKNWRKQSTAAGRQVQPAGTVVFLVNAETREVAEQLARGLTEVQPVIVAATEPGRQLAQSILAQTPQLAGLIDLSDLHGARQNAVSVNFGKISLVQELLQAVRLTEFRLLHFTKGLQTYDADETTLAGADMAGLVKMLGAEYRKVLAKTIDIDSAIDDVAALRQTVLAEWAEEAVESEVILRRQGRFVPLMREQELPGQSDLSVDAGKVYVVTGGTRGLGAEVAKHLVRKGARKLVLMGVRPFPERAEWEGLLSDPQADQALKSRLCYVAELEQQGVRVELYTGALTDRARLEAYFQDIRRRLGSIGGIVHCAGAANAATAFVNKTEAELKTVFEPKIMGLQTLHALFQADRPDFFVLFSSVSGCLPTLAAGASDYGMANAFMDYFAAFQQSQGCAYYRSIQWPSWKGVGMGEVTSHAYTALGLLAHPADVGIDLFDRILGTDQPVCVIPAVVQAQSFNAAVLLRTKHEQRQAPAARVTTEPTVPIATPAAGGSTTMQMLKELFAQELRIPAGELDEKRTFGDFGVDSVLLGDLVKQIEARIGQKLDPSVLLEYSTLQSLSQRLNDTYASHAKTTSAAQALETVAASEAALPADATTPVPSMEHKHLSLGFDMGKRYDLQPLSVRAAASSQDAVTARVPATAPSRKIAVIGMACHFPGATNKHMYWQNLAAGKSSVVEIPKLRWDADRLYSPVYEKGRTTSKWGGFIEGIEEFDPDYFQFSVEDAPHVDPLIRQFLEVSVQTLRDAGYADKELWNRRVGVFVGSRVGNYADRIRQPHKNTVIGLGQNFIAAHVAHFFNFKGPNMVVDTACSSSLVSIHLACQSLVSGESELALAGGVDILLDEKPYLILSEGRALSPDGKCHTFDEKANGFVPGEGCGAVLLKTLERAMADGDRIYAVIEATAINNDGHTMGVTTPNPEAQMDVIRAALQNGNISPDSISYVETHGTGTMIGDPIELKALTRIYREFTEEKQFCGVGSVKTNFGHLLSAAGIASFIKVVLSLHHKQLPPTLNCEKPNPRFQFEESPFYPNTWLGDWAPRQGIRRAGISAFGFGGTNAHLIVAECEPDLSKGYQPQRSSLPPVKFNRKRFWVERTAVTTEDYPLLKLERVR